MGEAKTKGRSRKRVVLMITAAILAEAVFLIWPLVCIAFRKGFLHVGTLLSVAITLAFGLILGIGTGLAFRLAFGLGYGFGIAFGASLGVAFGVDLGYSIGTVSHNIVWLSATALCAGLGIGIGTGIGIYTGIFLALLFAFGTALVHLKAGFAVWLAQTSASFSAFSGGILIGRGLKSLFAGATTAIKQFFKPWESGELHFWRAIGFFVLVYIGVILYFSVLFYAFHLEGVKELPTNKTFFDTKGVIGTQSWWDFVYFSFVTITTTGYGDITPIHWFPQFLVFLETLTGIGLIVGFLGMILKVMGEARVRRAEMRDAEREDIVKRFLLEFPTASDGWISKIVGCDERLVSQVRRELQDSGDLPKPEIDDDRADDI